METAGTKGRKGGGFLPRLQAVRGIAALIVCVFHSCAFFTVKGKDIFWLHILQSVVNGPGAVFIFFILSGFVLGQTLKKVSPNDIGSLGAFLRRRLLRLYPPIIFSTICFAIYYLHFFPKDGFGDVSPWFGRPALSWMEFLKNAACLSFSFDLVKWSLLVEILFSLLLPLIYFAAARSLVRNISVFVLMILIYRFFGYSALHIPVNVAPWSYLFVCYAGWMLALFGEEARRFYALFPKWIFMTLLILCFVLCLTVVHFGRGIVGYTVAGTFLIGAVVFGRYADIFTFLDNRALIALGNISFSFYLFHLLSEMLVGQFMTWVIPHPVLLVYPWISALALTCLSISLNVPIALASYFISERPFTSRKRKAATDPTVSAEV